MSRIFKWFCVCGIVSHISSTAYADPNPVTISMRPDQSGNPMLMLTWTNNIGVGYEVYRRERLELGDWLKVSNLDPGPEQVRSYTFTLDPSVPRMFYQIVEIPFSLNSFKPLELGEGASMEFVKIPAGEFTMGSPVTELDRENDEGPLTEVTLSKSFLLGKYEVTQLQWMAIMGDNPSNNKGNDLPVEKVSWIDCVEFCRRLTERERVAGRLPEGLVFTLPTEAQWEYACRAGSTSRFYYGDDMKYEHFYQYGNYCDLVCEHSWRESEKSDGYSKTAPVGSFHPNAWGIYDMHGNVWEWCLDFYAGGSLTDPRGPGSGLRRVGRGGSWLLGAWVCRSANRTGWMPDISNRVLGFRVALSYRP